MRSRPAYVPSSPGRTSLPPHAPGSRARTDLATIGPGDDRSQTSATVGRPRRTRARVPGSGEVVARLRCSIGCPASPRVDFLQASRSKEIARALGTGAGRGGRRRAPTRYGARPAAQPEVAARDPSPPVPGPTPAWQAPPPTAAGALHSGGKTVLRGLLGGSYAGPPRPRRR